MSRIFSSLALASLLLILTTLIYGIFGGDYNGLATQLRKHSSAGAGTLASDVRLEDVGVQHDDESLRSPARDAALLSELRAVQRHARNHMLLGILTAIVTSLVQCIGVTYFIGTGRWFKEVVAAYSLDESILIESNGIKRTSFPYAILGIATIMVIASLGAAADPGTLRANTQAWVAPHYWSAIVGLCVIAFALGKQANAIVTNQSLIDRVMALVREARLAQQLRV